MNAKYIWYLGSSIFILLGIIHLFYTFFTNNFSSRNKVVVDEMKSSYPYLTNETTIWKAWVGFNASHSIGAIFFGLINYYLSYKFYSILQNDFFLFGINILTVIFYLWLAKKYWFKMPFIAILLTLICYVISFIIVITN